MRKELALLVDLLVQRAARRHCGDAPTVEYVVLPVEQRDGGVSERERERERVSVCVRERDSVRVRERE